MNKRVFLILILITIILLPTAYLYSQKEAPVNNQSIIFKENPLGIPYPRSNDNVYTSLNPQIIEWIKQDERVNSFMELNAFYTLNNNYERQDPKISGVTKDNELVVKIYENGEYITQTYRDSMGIKASSFTVFPFVNEKEFISQNCIRTFDTSSLTHNVDELHVSGYIDIRLFQGMSFEKGKKFGDIMNDSTKQYTLEFQCYVPTAYNKEFQMFDVEPVILKVDIKGVVQLNDREPCVIYIPHEDMQAIIKKYAKEEIHQNIWLLETMSNDLLEEIQEKDNHVLIHENIW